MKVLLDSCVSAQAAGVLRQANHDVIWSGDWPKDPGDQEILHRAAAESRVLVTIDNDFGELVIVQGRVHVGLIRLVGFRAGEQGSALVRLLAIYETELAAAAILTVDPWRVRIRPGAVHLAPARLNVAKIENLAVSFTGEIHPDDMGQDWIRGAKWPLEFSLQVDARFDQPVTAGSASLEIIREDGGQRIERIVDPIGETAKGITIQHWSGLFESVSIKEPGNYKIVFHVDGVEPWSRRWRIDRK